MTHRGAALSDCAYVRSSAVTWTYPTAVATRDRSYSRPLEATLSAG